MADISSITLPGGNTYNFKDAAARTLLDGHSVAADVPSDAVFTDTTYSEATTSTAGLMSASDKTAVNALNNVSTLEYEVVT